MGREGGTESDNAEHVTVCAHRVVPHEQLAGVSVVVEVINVFGLEERNGDFNCIGIVGLNLLRNNFRMFGKKRFENDALDTYAFQFHRVFTTLVVDKPLSEVVVEMYI